MNGVIDSVLSANFKKDIHHNVHFGTSLTLSRGSSRLFCQSKLKWVLRANDAENNLWEIVYQSRLTEGS